MKRRANHGMKSRIAIVGKDSEDGLSIGDKFLQFPAKVELHFQGPVRDAMQELADSLPHENDEALLQAVIWRGIEVVKRELEDSRLSQDAPVDSALGQDWAVKATQVPSPHYHIERYVGFPIQERLRQRLEDSLELLCPAPLSEEEAYAMLMDLGLTNFEQTSIPDVIRNVKEAARGRQGGRRNGALR